MLGLVLAGCATDGSRPIEGVQLERSQATKGSEGLFLAGERTQMSCNSREPLSSKHPLDDVVFVCDRAGIQATLAEMKDAGWRLIGLDIGKDSAGPDGTISMPLHITVIKLF